MTTLTVSGNGSGYRSIGDALRAAATGSVISVSPGEYAENLVLTKEVTVRAERGPGSVVVAPATGSVLLLAAPSATVRDVTLRGSDPAATAVDVPTGRLRLEHCEIVGAAYAAVRSRGSGMVAIADCRVENTVGAGIVLTAPGRSSLERCVLEGNGASALVLTGDAEPEVRDCTVRGGAGNGIFATGRARGRLADCDITATSQPAIALDGTSAPRIVRARIHDTQGIGVYATANTGAVLEDCWVADTGAEGVLLSAEADPVLRRCRVERAGIHVSGAARGSFDDCEVTGAQQPGVRVADTSRPTFNRLRVNGTNLHRGGVLVHDHGKATLVACSVTAAPGYGIEVRGPAELTLSGTTVRDGASAGIWLSGPADAHLARCDLSGNAGGGIRNEATGTVAIHECLTDTATVTATAGSRPAIATPPPDALGPLRTELESLVGLDNVKRDVQALVNLLQVGRQRQALGMPVPPVSRHLVFAGPPGTGKTTVARLYGRLLAALGVLPSGHVVEVGRADLVAQIVGGTAIKTTERFLEAVGGVFFIDEAYALTAQERGMGPDFGREAVDTLVKLMEDHRDEVVVIAAGYTTEMRGFIASNVGLASRFTRTIEFASYAPAELVTIVERSCAQHGYRLSGAAQSVLAGHFGGMVRGESFGNARVARQVFEEMVERQAQRLAGRTDLLAEDLAEFIPADVPR